MSISGGKNTSVVVPEPQEPKPIVLDGNEKGEAPLPVADIPKKVDVIEKSAKLSDEKIASITYKYGWGKFQPDCLQFFHKPRYLLVVMCYLAIVQGFVVNGIIPAVTTQFERRYHILSDQVGAINSMYDVGFAVMMLPISIIGAKGHKGRWLGIGAAVMGFGSLVCTIPHFAAGLYHYGAEFNFSCSATATSSGDNKKHSSLRNWSYLFMFGQMLHGFGASPLYTMGVTYLDENVSQRSSSLFVGIFNMCALIGPALGYLFAGWSLTIYGDIDKVDVKKVPMDPDDPRWYGAWWIGLILSWSFAWLIVPVVLGFGRQLPGSDKARLQDVDQAHQVHIEPATKPKWQSWHNLQMILRNPTYIGLIVEQVCTVFITGGFIVFLSKYLEVQYAKPTSEATFYTAGAALPAAFIGVILGTTLQRVIHLHTRGNIILSMTSTIGCIISCLSFLAWCSPLSFAGIDVNYPLDSNVTKLSLNHPCNRGCNCDMSTYQPLCSKQNHTMLFSPCWAGCAEVTRKNKTVIASNCSCVTGEISIPVGLCESHCPLTNFIAFMIGLFMIILFVHIKQNPVQQATLRCVPFGLRTFAMAIGWLPMRLFGSIPASPTIGAIVKSTCKLWQEQDGVREVCVLYDNQHLAAYLQITGVVGFSASLMALIISWRLYKPPPRPDTKTVKKQDEIEDVPKLTRVSLVDGSIIRH